MKTILTSLIAITACALFGCGHTNELSKYDIAKRTVLFQYRADPNAVNANTFLASTGDPVADIVASIGSSMSSDAVRRKLEKALNPDSLALYLTQGTEDKAITFIQMNPVTSINENPDFIIETVLKEYRIASSESGVHANVKGETTIYDRGSGKIVWQDNATETVALSETYVDGATPNPISTAIGVFNAGQLLNLPESRLRDVFTGAAEKAGNRIGESLRKDYANCR